MSDHQESTVENGVPQENLLEQILEESNLQRAWKRVKANGGASGIDGMTIAQFPAFAREQLPRLLDQIREGRYAPAAVRRTWIPKPNGDRRPLGIPTVLDRVIQQSIAQVLSPLFDPDFSESSFGFREGRNAHGAVKRVSEARQGGYHWGVDCDLKSYFETVNHDLLFIQLRRQVRDPRVLRLIGKYLRAGIRHEDGRTEKTLRGVPQGGPLSPLLANLMLDPLDRMIEELGWPFVRYADDFLIMTHTRIEALEVLATVRAYVEGKLKLLVNEDKSRVAPLGQCDFLGFNIRGQRIDRSEKSARRFKMRIREITTRSRGISMERRLRELRQYCVGWFHYFKSGLRYGEVLRWDSWIRRRVRLCYWKGWKRPGKRRRELLKMGIGKDEVKMASRSRKGPWRISANSILHRAMNTDWLARQGLCSLSQMWVLFKYGDQANT